MQLALKSVFAVFVLLSATGFGQDNPTTGNFCADIQIVPPAETHVPVQIRPEVGCAAEKFTSSVAFSEVGVCCPSYSNNVGNLTLTLYRWKSDYSQTVAETPLARKVFENFRDCAWLNLEFAPKLPAGEYLWTLTEATESVGVWKLSQIEDPSAVQCFLDGAPIEGGFEMSLRVCHSPFPYCGSAERFRKLCAGQTSPKKSGNADHVEWDVYADTWDAVDGLGRRVFSSESDTQPQSKKQVGIFYWTWHDWEGDAVNVQPTNNARVLAEFPEAIRDVQHPAWGRLHAQHHWDEPLLGFYRTVDSWVLRRHAQWLTDAGVDCIVFDATNGTHTWMESVRPLLETYAQIRSEGGATPKIAFMLPFTNREYTRIDLVQLYRDIYRDGHFQELWYYWNGRPLVYGIPESVEVGIMAGDENLTQEQRAELEAIRQFFSFRPGQPDYLRGPTRPDHWCWLECYPQHAYAPREDGTCEMCGVGVAQNHSRSKLDGGSGLAAMNDIHVFGRAYVVGQGEQEGQDVNPYKSDKNRFLHGDNFAQQWSRVAELRPDFVFVTGWNELIAGRAPEWCGCPNAFPDQFSPEFSRDIEPSRGILQDHFYYQLVDNVRKFKGVRGQRSADQNPIYRDARGDTLPRDCPGYGGIPYKNTTGRNDFLECSVSHDDANFEFCATCAAPLTSPTDPAWMRLFISVNLEETTSWEHFQYGIFPTKDGKTADVMRSLGGWKWEKIGTATVARAEETLRITVPRQLLGLETPEINLWFKWIDNTQTDGNILDVYTSGDAAPDGRFVYRYFDVK